MLCHCFRVTLGSIAVIAETELVAMHSAELMMSRIRISSQDGAVAQVQLPVSAGHPCGQKGAPQALKDLDLPLLAG